MRLVVEAVVVGVDAAPEPPELELPHAATPAVAVATAAITMATRFTASPGDLVASIRTTDLSVDPCYWS
jgi:hypothetical protein